MNTTIDPIAQHMNGAHSTSVRDLLSLDHISHHLAIDQPGVLIDEIAIPRP